MGGMGGNTVNLEIYGYDIAQTNLVAEELASRVKKIEGATNVQISRKKSKPELQIIFDHDKLMMHGLTTAQASSMIKNRVDGLTATRLRQSGDEYDVVVRYKESARNSITEIENMGIATPAGQVIRLGEIAACQGSTGPPRILRGSARNVSSPSQSHPTRDLLTLLWLTSRKSLTRWHYHQV